MRKGRTGAATALNVGTLRGREGEGGFLPGEWPRERQRGARSEGHRAPPGDGSTGGRALSGHGLPRGQVNGHGRVWHGPNPTCSRGFPAPTPHPGRQVPTVGTRSGQTRGDHSVPFSPGPWRPRWERRRPRVNHFPDGLFYSSLETNG